MMSDSTLWFVYVASDVEWACSALDFSAARGFKDSESTSKSQTSNFRSDILLLLFIQFSVQIITVSKLMPLV